MSRGRTDLSGRSSFGELCVQNPKRLSQAGHGGLPGLMLRCSETGTALSNECIALLPSIEISAFRIKKRKRSWDTRDDFLLNGRTRLALVST